MAWLAYRNTFTLFCGQCTFSHTPRLSQSCFVHLLMRPLILLNLLCPSSFLIALCTISSLCMLFDHHIISPQDRFIKATLRKREDDSHRYPATTHLFDLWRRLTEARAKITVHRLYHSPISISTPRIVFNQLPPSNSYIDRRPVRHLGQHKDRQ